MSQVREPAGRSFASQVRMGESVWEAMALGRERLSGTLAAVRSFATDRPAQALAAAFGVGVLAGWLIKRR
jgi:ElaB/YqjD/DUF883 family membrane-anchored ribosome-binding protein